MINQAIVLAGGLGTRLREVVRDVPKPMSDINGKPFLSFLFDYLIKQGIEEVILSVGYKREVIMDYFKDRYRQLKILYSVEEEPLGTGGAVKKALSLINNKEAFVMNGDTLFDINLELFFKLHKEKNSKFSIALKRLGFTDRYGSVEIGDDNKIIRFFKKASKYDALINGGTYIIDIGFFLSFETPQKFSLENDFLLAYCGKYDFFGFPLDGYFIDIGIPQDYERAKREIVNVLCR